MRVIEVANKYKVHRNTVKRWIEKGLLKATLTSPKWGGHDYYEITQKDLDIYLKKNNRETTHN